MNILKLIQFEGVNFVTFELYLSKAAFFFFPLNPIHYSRLLSSASSFPAEGSYTGRTKKKEKKKC